MSIEEPSGTAFTLGTFTLGTAFRPETIGDDAVLEMVRVLDFQDLAPSIERLRVWALAAGDVRRGEVCVDLGSGTGVMTRRLAELVGPEGQAIGIEPNGVLRTVAEQRAVAAGSTAVFRPGLATEIPLEDASVDLVWCERVLQHVPDAADRDRGDRAGAASRRACAAARLRPRVPGRVRHRPRGRACADAGVPGSAGQRDRSPAPPAPGDGRRSRRRPRRRVVGAGVLRGRADVLAAAPAVRRAGGRSTA